MMKVIIFGGSGFIGTKLSQELVRQGFSVVSVDMAPPKTPGIAFVKCACDKEIVESNLLVYPDVIINLAGRSIMGPWDREHKESIYSSRINTTKNIVSFMKKKEFKPKTFIQVSATGVYGDRGDETLSEGSETKVNTYLAQVAKDWEKEGSLASKQDIRTIILRQGNVIGEVGLLSAMKKIYNLGLGGPVGSGENWFPWIHVKDLVSIYVKVIKDTTISGVINAVAPEAIRYKEFSKQYAKSLNKPHFLKIPRFMFRLKYRDFLYEITSSQKVVSLRLWELGNIFEFKTIDKAINNIISIWQKH